MASLLNLLMSGFLMSVDAVVNENARGVMTHRNNAAGVFSYTARLSAFPHTGLVEFAPRRNVRTSRLHELT